MFHSPTFYFPTSAGRGLWDLITSFAALYPLLVSFKSLGEGLPVKLHEMLGEFKEWYVNNEEIIEDAENSQEPLISIESSDLLSLDSYTFVRAGLWWAVLARDNWTCCSCGRSSREDGIILEVDHIIPRSKGGTDDIENLQTLCKKCNIGKSNKDYTDLRKSTSVV